MLVRAIAHGDVRTPKETLHWKLTLGRASLGAPGNRTCVSSVLVRCSIQLSQRDDRISELHPIPILEWGSARETWCAALVCRCICFCCSVYLSVCLAGNFTLPRKYKVKMSGEAEVNCGLSLPAILKGIQTSNQIFARIYGTLGHPTTSLNTQNESKGVDQVSTAVTANGVCFIPWNIDNNGDRLMICLTSLPKFKRKCVQFTSKMHPRISDAKLGNNQQSYVNGVKR